MPWCCWSSRRRPVFGDAGLRAGADRGAVRRRRRVWGPVIGAAVLVPLAETLNAQAGDPARHPGRGVRRRHHRHQLVAPEGMFWRLRDFLAARRAAAITAPVGNGYRLSAVGRSRTINVAPASPAERNAAEGGEVLLKSRSREPRLRRPQGGRRTSSLKFAPERSSASSARTAPARRRCSTSSTASCAPTAADHCSPAPSWSA